MTTDGDQDQEKDFTHTYSINIFIKTIYASAVFYEDVYILFSLDFIYISYLLYGRTRILIDITPLFNYQYTHRSFFFFFNPLFHLIHHHPLNRITLLDAWQSFLLVHIVQHLSYCHLNLLHEYLLLLQLNPLIPLFH